jgi:putative Holliday junction resolvase
MAPKTNATVLAFDFGTRRIGVAVGNTLIRFAQPLVTVAGDSAATTLAAIAALVDEWQPQQLVVGLPLHADGTPHAMTAKARDFARGLGERFGLPVALVDERWTTEIAQDELNRERGGRDGRAERDEIAAQVILQAYFDEQPRDAGDS